MAAFVESDGVDERPPPRASDSGTGEAREPKARWEVPRRGVRPVELQRCVKVYVPNVMARRREPRW